MNKPVGPSCSIVDNDFFFNKLTICVPIWRYIARPLLALFPWMFLSLRFPLSMSDMIFFAQTDEDELPKM